VQVTVHYMSEIKATVYNHLLFMYAKTAHWHEVSVM